MTKRFNVQREIERLDPKEDCQRIAFLTATLEFPWDLRTALELALFRTYAVPSISGLLDHTGEFANAPQRRYDDTVILLNEILVNGYDSKRGMAFLERMNAIHALYRIKNEDFLYTLGTFVFVPIDWIDRFGYRKLYPNERLAQFYFWREVGKRMNIQDIPETFEEFRAFYDEYEQKRFRFHEANQRVGDATRDLLLSFYLPKPLWKIAHPAVYAMMDDALLSAMGYPKPSAWVRGLVQGALRARAAVVRVLPKNTRPRVPTFEKMPTYPNGYTVEDIGPAAFHAKVNGQVTDLRKSVPPAGSGCPFSAPRAVGSDVAE